MIIKQKKYNEVRTLLIETDATGLPGHIHTQDGGQKVSVTVAAVCMGWKGMEAQP